MVVHFVEFLFQKKTKINKTIQAIVSTLILFVRLF